MKSKSFWITCVVLYVVLNGLGYLIHQVWLTETYQGLADVFRPEAEIKMSVMFITSAIWTIMFVYIFSRGYEGKGVMEGVRFGLVVGIFYSLVSTYDQYAVYPIPYSLTLKWFFSGLVVSIILGVIASLLYKPESSSAA